MVEEALAADREVSSAELRRRAAEIDPSIAEMEPRRFNALYPLQVKRARGGRGGGKGAKKTASKRGAGKSGGQGAVGKRTAKKRGAGGTPAAEATPARGRRGGGGGRGGRGGAGGGGGEGREGIRRALHDFATEVAGAETRAEIARVLAGVEEYVERIAKLTGR